MSNFRSSWPQPQPSSRQLNAPTRGRLDTGTSFTDEVSQMRVVVLENVSMVFHQPFEGEDDSAYDYSVDAPSNLCENTPPMRLDSSDYAANHNISQYFRTQTSLDDDASVKDEPDERPALERDDILGSLPVLIPSKPQTPPSREPEPQSMIDRQAYVDKVLGIDDESTSKTASMDSSYQNEAPVYELPKQKKGWFGFGRKDKKQKKGFFKRSTKRSVQPVTPVAPRKAPLKRTPSEMRRASF